MYYFGSWHERQQSSLALIFGHLKDNQGFNQDKRMGKRTAHN